MLRGQPFRTRSGRFHQESTALLVMLLVLGLVTLRWLSGAPVEAPKTWDGAGTLVSALLYFLGLVVGLALLTFAVLFALVLIDLTYARTPAARRAIVHDFVIFTLLCCGAVVLLLVLLPLLVVLVPIWLVALALEAFAWVRRVRTEKKLARLRQFVHEGAARSTPAHLRQAVKLLGSRDDSVRQQALHTVACLLRGNPDLAESAAVSRLQIEHALQDQLGFARALREGAWQASLPTLVTLGGKVGAGTAEKRISPATSDPEVLAGWLYSQRDATAPQEVQVSIGYDTGPLPAQLERGKFLALYLFIASTDLKRFQALTHKPPRDPNAAFGLLIRGDRVEVLYPGQASGKRLDYVFTLPAQLSEKNLAEFLRQLQLLNFGMLLAAVEESHRAFFPGEAPPGLDERTRAVAHAYRGFERRFVALLRQHDAHRDPERIFRLDPVDHRERQAAFRDYHLEDCLYPRYPWVVPLYGEDTSWELLLPALRAVEAMMLHQGSVEDRTVTRGLAFIQAVRLLGYRTALAIEDALAEPHHTAGPNLLLDPFIDADNEPDTTRYLRATTKALQEGQVSLDALPDATTFRNASAYYGIAEAEVSTCPPSPER
jgi:hypothetical protein